MPAVNHRQRLHVSERRQRAIVVLLGHALVDFLLGAHFTTQQEHAPGPQHRLGEGAARIQLVLRIRGVHGDGIDRAGVERVLVEAGVVDDRQGPRIGDRLGQAIDTRLLGRRSFVRGALRRSAHDGKHGCRGPRAGPCALVTSACRLGPGARSGCRAWCAPTGVARGQLLRRPNLPVDRQVYRPPAGTRRTSRRASPPRGRGQVLPHRNLPVDRQVSRPAATMRRARRRASPPRGRGQVLPHRNLPVDRQVSRSPAGTRRASRRASPRRERGQVLPHRNLPVDRQVSRPAAGDGRSGWQASAPPDAPRSAPAPGPLSGAGSAPGIATATALTATTCWRATAASNAPGNASTRRSMSASSAGTSASAMSAGNAGSTPGRLGASAADCTTWGTAAPACLLSSVIILPLRIELAMRRARRIAGIGLARRRHRTCTPRRGGGDVSDGGQHGAPSGKREDAPSRTDHDGGRIEQYIRPERAGRAAPST